LDHVALYGHLILKSDTLSEKRFYLQEADMRKKTRSYYLLGITIVVALLSSGFLAVGMAAEEGSQTGEVIFVTGNSNFGRVGGDPATYSSGGGPSVSHTVFDGLTIEDWNKRDVAAIAKSWKISPDWKYYDFFLREDVKFHDGSPVTAEDVKYSIETYMRKDLRFMWGTMYRALINRVEVMNPYHVRIFFHRCYMGFEGQFGFGAGVMPKAYREKVGDKGFADKPIGAGPFKWKDYRQDQWFLLEAVKKHYRYTPEYKNLKFVYVPEHATRLAMLKSGEADIVSLIGPHIEPVKNDPNLRIVYTPYVTGTIIAFADLMKTEDPSPFHDIRVRKAASLAIDRATICQKVLFGAAEPYGEVLAPHVLGYDPSVKPDPYDPKGAKALLAEAGYPNGFETTLNTTVGGKYWMEAVMANLSDIGIKAKLNLYEGGAWWEAFRAKNLRGLISAVSFFNAPYTAPENLQLFYVRLFPFAYVTNREISRALIEANCAIDEDEIAEWDKKISKLIRDSRINIHLWVSHSPYGVGPKIAFFKPKVGSSPSQAYEYIRLKR